MNDESTVVIERRVSRWSSGFSMRFLVAVATGGVSRIKYGSGLLCCRSDGLSAMGQVEVLFVVDGSSSGYSG